MKGLKNLVIAAAIVSSAGMPMLGAFAQGAGVVDIEKIYNSYSKVQDISADLRLKQAEFQKLYADAEIKIKSAKTPIEKKNIEDKLTQEYQNLQDVQRKQEKLINDDVVAAVDTVSKSRKLDLILYKTSVMQGGTDISEEVLTILNKK